MTTASSIMPPRDGRAGPSGLGNPQASSGTRFLTRYLLVATVVSLCVCFVALGVWQVERRTWKLALIERVEQRVHAEPADAPGPERWPAVDAAHDEYRHVRATGMFLTSRATFVQAVTDYGRGYWAIVPLRLQDGAIVLINRGFVADSTPSRASSDEPVVVTGLLRVTEPRGSRLHDNDPARDRWYSRDVQAIARLRGLERVAPYFIDADAAPAGGHPAEGEPIGGLTVIAFRNDHLTYAITWFTLALLCAEAVRRLLFVRSTMPRYGGDR